MCGFRFEWQFGLGAMISTLHDVLTTVGLFAIFQLEFNLTTLAAILTVAAIDQRHGGDLRPGAQAMGKYRTMPFRDLVNLALNETLSRTILTVSTVALAVLSLLIFGGEVLKGFQHRDAVGHCHRHLLVAVSSPPRYCNTSSPTGGGSPGRPMRLRPKDSVSRASCDDGVDPVGPGGTPDHRALWPGRVFASAGWSIAARSSSS